VLVLNKQRRGKLPPSQPSPQAEEGAKATAFGGGLKRQTPAQAEGFHCAPAARPFV
jgi:hypothetical protein